MTAKNDITGDSIRSKTSSDAYRSNYDLIFGKNKSQIDSKDDELTDTDADSKVDQQADE